MNDQYPITFRYSHELSILIIEINTLHYDEKNFYKQLCEVSESTVFSGPYFPGSLCCIPLYSLRIRENPNQKNLHIRTFLRNVNHDG